jgi:hypothetical protein
MVDITGYGQDDILTLDELTNIPSDERWVEFKGGFEYQQYGDDENKKTLYGNVQLSNGHVLKMKMSPRLARNIGRMLGSMRTEDWENKRVYLAVKYSGTKKYLDVVYPPGNY